MATPVFCCGFECGIASPHWTLTGTSSFDTSTIRSGLRSIRINPTTSVAHATSIAVAASTASWVIRCYVYFATLPSAECCILSPNASGTKPGIWFTPGSNILRVRNNNAGGFPGSFKIVTTGVWYRLELKAEHDGVNRIVSGFVDDTTLGTHSSGLSAATATQINIGDNTVSVTADMYFDDVIISNTLADFPIGLGKVEPFTVLADGTHSISGTNDFERGTSPTDILNATTDAYTLVDDVPLTTTLGTDYINMIAPPSAADYVECIFGPAPGISAPIKAPRAVEVIAAIAQAGTGAGNMEVRLNDNGTTDPVYSATGVAGVTSVAFKRKHYASGPAGPWVIGGGGNGDFTDLRVQFGSPAALDVNPDQYFKSIMIEAEFIEEDFAALSSIHRNTEQPYFAKTVVTPSGERKAAAFSVSAPNGLYRSITLDQPASDLTDFPVLFSGTYSFLKLISNGGNVYNGNDIRFYSDSGLTTLLKYERVEWNGATGQVEFWIKIPTLTSASPTVIYIAYGNPAWVTDQQDKNAVWTNGYGGVWHYPDGGTISMLDSTSNNNKGKRDGNGSSDGLMEVTPVAGKIGGGVEMDGDPGTGENGFINNGASSTLNPTEAITLSCWVNITGSAGGAYHTLISKWQGAGGNSAFLVGVQQSGGAIFFDINNDAAVAVGSIDIRSAGWKYVVATYDKSNLRIYNNGVADGTTPALTASIFSSSANFVVGTNVDSPQGHLTLDGLIDEVRVSSVARSVDWIAAEFSNQNDPSGFYSLGGEVAI